MKKSALVALLVSTAAPLLSMENSSRSSMTFFGLTPPGSQNSPPSQQNPSIPTNQRTSTMMDNSSRSNRAFFDSTPPVNQNSQQPQSFSTPSRSTIPTLRMIRSPNLDDLVPKHRRLAINNALEEGNNNALALNLARLLLKRPQIKFQIGAQTPAQLEVQLQAQLKARALYEGGKQFIARSLITNNKQQLRIICQHSKTLLNNKKKIVQYLRKKALKAACISANAEAEFNENAQGEGLIKWCSLYLLKVAAWSATASLSLKNICSADSQPAIYKTLSCGSLGLSAYNISTNLLNLYNHVSSYKASMDQKEKNLIMLRTLFHEAAKEINDEHADSNSADLLKKLQIALSITQNSQPSAEDESE
jgi:hypothetical protein